MSRARPGADRVPDDEAARLELDLAETLTLLETVDWRRVPGVSVTTAATFAHQLQTARADLEARGDR